MDNKSKYHTLYWGEYADKIISRYNLKTVKKDREYNGACPACGGQDRFRINEYNGELRVHCRQCNDFSSIYDEMRHDGVLPTEYELQNKSKLHEVVNDTADFSTFEPYHKKKGIDLLGGAMVSDNNVIVPMLNKDFERVNTQTISPNGFKKFEKDKQVTGAFAYIGGLLKGKVYIAEGYATAVSVHMSTGLPCIAAMSASGLVPIAKMMQDMRPDCTFIIAADNDKPGKDYAQKTGLPYVAPKGAEGRDWNDVMLEDGKDAVEQALKKVKLPKPLFMPIGDLEFTQPKWLIEGLLEDHTFAVCFGSPAAGKTFLTLDMALCIATGTEFHGHAVKQGSVFYIAGEGHNGFARRAAAWSKANQTPLKGVPFFKSSRSVILTEDDEVQKMLHTVTKMAETYGKPSLIVIDTLARSMGAADENSTKDMGAAIRAIDDIADEYDCTVLAVHHTGHSSNAKDRARGSSALLGAVDAEFKVERWFSEEDIPKIEVKFTKMKDAMMPEPMNFAHHICELVGADGEKTSSVVLEKIDDSKPLPGNDGKQRERNFIKVLHENKSIDDGMDEDDLRKEYYKTLPDKLKRNSKNKSYNSCKDSLLEKRIIRHEKGRIFYETNDERE